MKGKKVKKIILFFNGFEFVLDNGWLIIFVVFMFVVSFLGRISYNFRLYIFIIEQFFKGCQVLVVYCMFSMYEVQYYRRKKEGKREKIFFMSFQLFYDGGVL